MFVKFNRFFLLALFSYVAVLSQADKATATASDPMLLTFDVPASTEEPGKFATVVPGAEPTAPAATAAKVVEDVSMTVEPSPEAVAQISPRAESAPLEALPTIPIVQESTLTPAIVTVEPTVTEAAKPELRLQFSDSTLPLPPVPSVIPDLAQAEAPVIVPDSAEAVVPDPLQLQVPVQTAAQILEPVPVEPPNSTSGLVVAAPTVEAYAPAPVPTPVQEFVLAPIPAPVQAPVQAPVLVSVPASVPASVLPSVPAQRTDSRVITGVDVSSWQDNVDWVALKNNGVDFAYLKSTEGKTFTDAYFAQNRKNARDSGIITGAYHFFRPATSVSAQVDHFINVVGKLSPDDLPPALDLEDKSLWVGYTHKEKIDMVMEWLTAVESRTGVRPIIYASPSFVEDVLGSAPQLANYKLWIAHYTDNSQPSLPTPFTEWLIWQHSSSGSLPGVAGNVDLNRFQGDVSELLAEARQTPTQAPTQVASVVAHPDPMPLAAVPKSSDEVAELIINFDLPPVS